MSSSGRVPGSEEPGEGKTEHRELPSSHHCPHQEARSQVPAGLQRAERHCESETSMPQKFKVEVHTRLVGNFCFTLLRSAA